MNERARLARELTDVATDLERRLYPGTGALRRAARVILGVDQLDTDGCKGCGNRLTQPSTGRRREWCSERCRNKARRR